MISKIDKLKCISVAVIIFIAPFFLFLIDLNLQQEYLFVSIIFFLIFMMINIDYSNYNLYLYWIASLLFIYMVQLIFFNELNDFYPMYTIFACYAMMSVTSFLSKNVRLIVFVIITSSYILTINDSVPSFFNDIKNVRIFFHQIVLLITVLPNLYIFSRINIKSVKRNTVMVLFSLSILILVYLSSTNYLPITYYHKYPLYRIADYYIVFSVVISVYSIMSLLSKEGKQ